jgi:hypothetical protein
VEKLQLLLDDVISAAGWVAVVITAIGFLADHIATELLACSACAGDYEDPEAVAWTEPEEGPDENGPQH